MSLPPNKNLLKEFPNPVYLETGIYRCDSIHQAMEAGFETIIGLDNDQSAIDFCFDRFTLRQQVEHEMQFLKADSAVDLWKIIEPINHRITFFLDAHFQLIEGTEKGDNPFPLMKELEQIAKHPIKNHTIIIDDLLYLTHPDITGWTRREIANAILEINRNYKMNLIANPVINNMLVAWIE